MCKQISRIQIIGTKGEEWLSEELKSPNRCFVEEYYLDKMFLLSAL